MKHSAKRLMCIALVLCALLSFGACKKNAAPQVPAAVPANTASIYYLSGVSYGEEVYTADQLLISDPAETYIFFDGNGFGILCIDTFEEYFEYADGQLWYELDPETKVNYSVSGNALTLEQDGYKIVFTKGELPEWAIQEEDTQEELPEEELPTEELPAEAQPTEEVVIDG